MPDDLQERFERARAALAESLAQGWRAREDARTTLVSQREMLLQLRDERERARQLLLAANRQLGN